MSSSVELPGNVCSVFVNELRPGRTSKKIIGRVSRLWINQSFQKGNRFASLDFLLIDEKTQCIVCSIKELDITRLAGLIEEGKVYQFQNFTVSVMQPLYRVWHEHDLCVSLDSATFIEEVISNSPPIIKNKFNLIPYDQLFNVSEDRKNLCDIIGYVSGVFGVRKAILDGQRTAMQTMELTNTSGKTVKLIIWGDDLNEVASRMLDNGNRFWIITSTAVSHSDKGGISVETTKATRLYSSYEIDEVYSFTSSSHFMFSQRCRGLLIPRNNVGGDGCVLALPSVADPARTRGNVNLANELTDQVFSATQMDIDNGCAGPNKKAKKHFDV